ncbi:MAG: hypothetical protein AAGC55_17375, partial [Myxococcota bacterium]
MSDTITEGDPRVIQMNVFSETGIAGATSFPESPAYCSPDEDERVSTLYCFDDDGELIPGSVTDAIALNPTSSDTYTYVRVVFNELLVASEVEEVVEGFGSLVNTQPLDIECGGTAIAYDGWYQPSGNNVTDPPGPAIVAQFLDYPGLETECEVSVKSELRDKDLNTMDTSLVGPFSFTTDILRLLGTVPGNEETGIATNSGIVLSFNGMIETETVEAAVTIDPAIELS